MFLVHNRKEIVCISLKRCKMDMSREQQQQQQQVKKQEREMHRMETSK